MRTKADALRTKIRLIRGSGVADADGTPPYRGVRSVRTVRIHSPGFRGRETNPPLPHYFPTDSSLFEETDLR